MKYLQTTVLVLGIMLIHMCTKETYLIPETYQEPAPDSILQSDQVIGLTHAPYPGEPETAAGVSACTVVFPFTTPYAMTARFQRNDLVDIMDAADSVLVEVRAPGNAFTNYFTWYTASGGFDDEGLKQLIQSTYVAQFVLLINHSDPSNEYYELWVGVTGPAVQANTTAFDRPGLYIQPYVGGSKAGDIGYVFEKYYIWPTVSMDILETQLAIEEFAHTYLNLQDTGLDPAEINTVVTWYENNCITGDKVRLNGAVFDTAYVVPLFTDLGWNVTY